MLGLPFPRAAPAPPRGQTIVHCPPKRRVRGPCSAKREQHPPIARVRTGFWTDGAPSVRTADARRAGPIMRSEQRPPRRNHDHRRAHAPRTPRKRRPRDERRPGDERRTCRAPDGGPTHRAARSRRGRGGVPGGARRRSRCHLYGHGGFQRAAQGGELHGRGVRRRLSRGASGGSARLRDREHRHQGCRDAARARACPPLRRAGRRRLHHPGLGPLLRDPPPYARARAPCVHAGEHPRCARGRMVPRRRRGARDALARALDRRDRPHPPLRRYRPGSLRPRVDLLLLLGRVPALQLRLPRALGEPRHVRPALPAPL